MMVDKHQKHLLLGETDLDDGLQEWAINKRTLPSLILLRTFLKHACNTGGVKPAIPSRVLDIGCKFFKYQAETGGLARVLLGQYKKRLQDMKQVLQNLYNS